MNIQSLAILFLIIFSNLTIQAGAYSEIKVIGQAKNSAGQPIYTEFHTIKKDERGLDSKIITEYHDTKGLLIAKAESDFSYGPFAPKSTLEDLRTKTIQQAIPKPDQKIVKLVQQGPGKSDSKSIPLHNELVINQGFNNYVLQMFDRLTNKEKLFPRFAVLERLTYFNFQTSLLQKANNQYTFSLNMNSWVLRQFVEPIKVTYSEDRRLLRYQGLSNLQDSDGNQWIVDIDYTYPQ